MISFDVADGRRRLVVTSWDKWNSVDETASLRRDRHMARKAATQRVTNGKGSRSGTPPDRDRIGDRNAIVTRLDQIRGDQNPQTPVPGASDFSPEPDPDDPEPRAKALAALATLSAQTAPFLPESEP
jgi:hypothetical protein